jgi:hypothetical protein
MSLNLSGIISKQTECYLSGVTAEINFPKLAWAVIKRPSINIQLKVVDSLQEIPLLH